MHFTMFVRALIISIILIFPLFSSSQPASNWTPQKDEVYLQEISTQIPTDDPVTDIIANQDIDFALIKDQLYKIKDQNITPVNNPPAGIKKQFQEQVITTEYAQDDL